jgi:hypothetical protein
MANSTGSFEADVRVWKAGLNEALQTGTGQNSSASEKVLKKGM